MRYGKTGTIAAAFVLALGLAARADDEQERRGAAAPKATAREGDKQEVGEREGKARAGGDRERRESEEAADRPRRRDGDAGDRERRRDEAAERDEGRRGPRERGLIRREERMEDGMPGGPGMMGPAGPMRGMMRGMMMGRDGMPPGMPGMHPEEAMRRGMHPDEAMRREADPEMFELEESDRRLDHESHELAEHYRHAPEGPAREELRGKLQEVVARHFKVRQERRELEVKRLQTQLERLREALERRSKDSGAIIDHRMSQLLGEEDFGF